MREPDIISVTGRVPVSCTITYLHNGEQVQVAEVKAGDTTLVLNPPDKQYLEYLISLMPDTFKPVKTDSEVDP